MSRSATHATDSIEAARRAVPTVATPALDSRWAGLAQADQGNASRMASGLQASVGNRAVQRLIEGDGQPHGNTDVAARIDALSGTGLALESKALRKLEKSLGADLSGVRIHTGSEADDLSRSMGAKAFTTGTDIFFTAGAYDPFSSKGLELLAHETTHTLQQSEGAVDGTETPGGVSVSHPNDRFEQEARRVGEDVSNGRPSELSSSGQGADSGAHSVQRDLSDWFGGGDSEAPTRPVMGPGPYANSGWDPEAPSSPVPMGPAPNAYEGWLSGY